MIKNLKKLIRNKLKTSPKIINIDTSNLKAPSVNETFNYIIDLNPRVTSIHEQLTLFNLGSVSKGTVIEIGSYLCYTSVIIASSFNKSDGRKLYAIDMYDREKGWNQTHPTSDDSIFEKYSQIEYAKKVIRDCNQADSVITKKGKSSEFVEEMANINDIGLIFVDGDHTYDGVMQDLMNYSPMLNEGGYLVMHDYVCESHPEVRLAADEFLDKKSNYVPISIVNSMLVIKKR